MWGVDLFDGVYFPCVDFQCVEPKRVVGRVEAWELSRCGRLRICHVGVLYAGVREGLISRCAAFYRGGWLVLFAADRLSVVVCGAHNL